MPAERQSDFAGLVRSDGATVTLHSPTALPLASAFLWNQRLMLQMNCRGYCVAQFMQPEPAKYAHAPGLEAKTFMQPEQAFYAHHPGRFFYLKDQHSGEFFSLPHEPVRRPADRFEFRVSPAEVCWTIESLGLRAELSLSLTRTEVMEVWQLRLTNLSARARQISVYPYFPIGMMSWMNQAADYVAPLQGIVASCVTPYQKVADYFKQQHFADKTFLLASAAPSAWSCQQAVFEGEGGLHCPDGIRAERLACDQSRYETPAAILQHEVALAAGESTALRWLFGAAPSDAAIAAIQRNYFADNPLGSNSLDQALADYRHYILDNRACLQQQTPDKLFDDFANHWLPRQVYYHGDTNRLSTDPQTRNYLQDGLGLCFLAPGRSRQVMLTALAQQHRSGAMPDGILLHPDAELKYINQVPHTDHCVWLAYTLQVYLNETNDLALLDEPVPYAEAGAPESVAAHMARAMDWLRAARDQRGLSLIAQGDWCDPMNMVGWQGRGVSSWLTLASAYAMQCWADICARAGQAAQASHWRAQARSLNDAANRHCFIGQWYCRGITDAGQPFGIAEDAEGRIFLNPQSFALLSGAAVGERAGQIKRQVDEQLMSPYGVAMLAPAYTAMREDVGRLTQKFPGTAENGALYNHAGAFYAWALYQQGDGDRAFAVLRKMLPDDDYGRRGQLPVFIPNYYRGAWQQFPERTGRSSQLFNTGTVAWVYRCLVEGLYGLVGDGDGLRIAPQLPGHWPAAQVVRNFRGAELHAHYRRDRQVPGMRVYCNGQLLDGARIDSVVPGQRYQLDIVLPEKNP